MAPKPDRRNEELKKLLSHYHVPDGVGKFHGQELECESVDDFAEIVDEKKELKAAVVAKVPTAVSDAVGYSRLKLAFRAAQDKLDERIKRQSQGYADTALDEPLDPDVLRGMHEGFLLFWHIVFAPEDVGSDRLLSKFRRELDRSQHALANVPKAKSQAQVYQVKEATITLSKRARVHLGEEEEQSEMPINNVLDYLNQLEMVMNTYAVAGARWVKKTLVVLPLEHLTVHPDKPDHIMEVDFGFCLWYLRRARRATQRIDSSAAHVASCSR